MFFKVSPRIRIYFLTSVFFGAYILCVIRPVFVLYRDTQESCDFLLRRLVSVGAYRQRGFLPEYDDKTGTPEALSMIEAFARQEKIEIDDIKLKDLKASFGQNTSLLELHIHGPEEVLSVFLAGLKKMSFLCRIASVQVKAGAGTKDEFQARLCLEKIDFARGL